jgi:hypothetical protein
MVPFNGKEMLVPKEVIHEQVPEMSESAELGRDFLVKRDIDEVPKR